MKRKEKIKKVIKNISLMLFTLIILFGGLELFFRRVIPVSDASQEFDSLVGAKHTPNKIYTSINKLGEKNIIKANSKGYLDEEFSTDKYNIVMLGDSFTEAFHVDTERAFHRQLELDLRNVRPDIDVMNFGVGGFGTAEELLTLKHEALNYKPKLVILMFYPGNDLADNYLPLGKIECKPHFILEGTSLKQLEFKPCHSPIVKKLYLNFKLLLYLHNKIRLVGQRVSNNAQPCPVCANESDSNWNNAWDITEALIFWIKEESESNNAKFLLVYLPLQVQVETELLSEEYAKEIDLDKPNKIIKKFCEDNDINCLDLTPHLREKYNRNKSKLYGDHFNEAGHKLVAELIYEKLINDKLIGP